MAKFTAYRLENGTARILTRGPKRWCIFCIMLHHARRPKAMTALMPPGGGALPAHIAAIANIVTRQRAA